MYTWCTSQGAKDGANCCIQTGLKLILCRTPKVLKRSISALLWRENKLRPLSLPRGEGLRATSS